MTAPLPSWVAADIDLRTPSVARVYDFLLGGMHNFAVDREISPCFTVGPCWLTTRAVPWCTPTSMSRRRS